MTEQEATGKLGSREEQNVSSKLGKQNLDQNKAEAKADAEFVQDSDDKNFLNLGYGDLYHEAAEDADDEIGTDDDYEENDYEEIRPLNIKKVKTSKVSNSVPLSTNHPEQTTQTTAHTHHRVEWADNLAQAQEDSAEASHTAPIASEFNLPRAPTPYPEPLAIHKYPDLLHPSPPLRRRKGSMALRKKPSESANAHSMMPKTGENQDALYGHNQDHVAGNSYNSDTYATPSHRGKIAEAHGNQNAFSGEDQGNTAENDESSEASLNLDFPFWKNKTSGLSKTHAEEGREEEHTTTVAKSMTNAVTSPKASNKKRTLRNFFSRKSSKESTSSPSSSSGKAAGRKIISAPTLVDASPNAKTLLNSASPLINTPSDAKKVVNYSRPTAPQSSNNVSSGSPVGRGRSGSGMRGPNPSLGPSTSPEEDGESFNPSDHSGDEDSVQRAIAVPVVASGRAKLVQVRPPRAINTAASDNQPGMGIAVTSRTSRMTDEEAMALGVQDADRYKANVRPSRAVNTAASDNQPGTGIALSSGTSRMTDEEAMALGAQDAERYIANAMTSQIRPAATNTDDPFVGPAFQNLLTKPGNEISQRTALGGSVPTDEERAHASALGSRRAAGQTGSRVQKKGDNTTARGQLEGYSHT